MKLPVLLLLPVPMLAGYGAPQAVQQPSLPVVQTKIIDNGCKWVKFITASPDDTPGTKRQIIAHDQVYQANFPMRSAEATVPRSGAIRGSTASNVRSHDFPRGGRYT